MKRFFAILLLAAAFTAGIVLTTSCSKSSDGGGGGGASLKIPNMTATVSTSASVVMSQIDRQIANENLYQQSGVLFTGNAPSDPIASSVFGMVKSFVSQAKTADSFACMIEVLANNGIIKTDGTASVFSDDQSNQFKARFIVNASGSTLQSFKMYTCSASGVSNEFFVEGVLSGENMSFTMKYNLSGLLKGSMAMDGTWNGTNWTSKSLTMETFLGSGASIASKFLINQNLDNIIFKGTSNTGTPSSTYQIYSKFALLGNSPSTYAMGAGSTKYTVGSTVDALGHWDASGASTSTASAYSSDVTSGSYFPSNISFGGDMTTGQTWDCTLGSDSEIKFTGIGSNVSTAIQSCMENQE